MHYKLDWWIDKMKDTVWKKNEPRERSTRPAQHIEFITLFKVFTSHCFLYR